MTLKEKLIAQVDRTIWATKIGGAVSSGVTPDGLVRIWHFGQMLCLSFANGQITHVHSFRHPGEKHNEFVDVGIPVKHQDKTLEALGDKRIASLAKFITNETEVQVVPVYVVTYKGRRVGAMLNQGIGKRGIGFPEEMMEQIRNAGFQSEDAARCAAAKMTAYLDDIRDKGNKNIKK